MTPGNLFKQNRYFFISYFILLMMGMFIVISYSKVDGFMRMNPMHLRPLDYFFIAATYLGDGIFIIALAFLFLLFKKKFMAFMIIASYAISGIIVQGIKFFYDAPRPAKLIDSTVYHKFVEGVTLHNFNSFPSGHTTSAFALAAVLGFTIKNKNYSILLLLVAAMVGYSRIYLGQHFLEDVLAGSVVGMFSAIIVEVFLAEWIRRISIKK